MFIVILWCKWHRSCANWTWRPWCSIDTCVKAKYWRDMSPLFSIPRQQRSKTKTWRRYKHCILTWSTLRTSLRLALSVWATLFLSFPWEQTHITLTWSSRMHLCWDQLHVSRLLSRFITNNPIDLCIHSIIVNTFVLYWVCWIESSIVNKQNVLFFSIIQ